VDGRHDDRRQHAGDPHHAEQFRERESVGHEPILLAAAAAAASLHCGPAPVARGGGSGW
jgi:hypothetical protein